MIFKKRNTLPPLVEMAIEEAHDLGLTGPAAYDSDTCTLTIEGLDPIRLGPVMDRVALKPAPHQRPGMRSAITRAIRANRVELPAHYAFLDEFVQERLRKHFADLRVSPGAAHPTQSIGRIERAFDIDGWRETILRAADRFASTAADKSLVVAHLGAANMYRLIERDDDAASHAESAMVDIRTEWGEQSLNPGSGELCDALLLAGRRRDLIDVAERFGQPQLGPRWWPVCTAAAAAERGDVESLEREVVAAERIAREEPIDAAGYGLTDRDLAEMLRSWLHELD